VLAQAVGVVVADGRRVVAQVRRKRLEALRTLAARADLLRVARAGGRRLARRMAAPVPERRVTFGATALTCCTGLRSPSDTSATITGVIAVAMIVPRSQIMGTTVAATTAAAAEINRVWIERPPPLFCSGSSAITIHASGPDPEDLHEAPLRLYQPRSTLDPGTMSSRPSGQRTQALWPPS
jgi:hypothetical protein